MSTTRLQEILNSFYLEKPEAERYDIRWVCPTLKIVPTHDEENGTVGYTAVLISGNGFKDRAAYLATAKKAGIDEALDELAQMLDDKTPFSVESIADDQNNLRTVSFIFSKEKNKWVFFAREMTIAEVKEIVAAHVN